jgi:Tc5 transposase DNA-binding domain
MSQKQEKREKKSIDLATKKKILESFKNGQKAAEVAKSFDLALSTVKTIRDRDATKISESVKAANGSFLELTSKRARNPILTKMEKNLRNWIQMQIELKIPVSQLMVQEKAKELYNSLNEKEAESAEETSTC